MDQVEQIGRWKIPATAMYNATVTLVRLMEVEKPDCSIALIKDDRCTVSTTPY